MIRRWRRESEWNDRETRKDAFSSVQKTWISSFCFSFIFAWNQSFSVSFDHLLFAYKSQHINYLLNRFFFIITCIYCWHLHSYIYCKHMIISYFQRISIQIDFIHIYRQGFQFFLAIVLTVTSRFVVFIFIFAVVSIDVDWMKCYKLKQQKVCDNYTFALR